MRFLRWSSHYITLQNKKFISRQHTIFSFCQDMSSYIDIVSQLHFCREIIKIRVGVLHIWKVLSRQKSKETVTSIEIIFSYFNVSYILIFFDWFYFIIIKLVIVFERILSMNSVYVMTNFFIIENKGPFRVTVHTHRLLFKHTTEVIHLGTVLNPNRNLSLLIQQMFGIISVTVTT